jgi:hypothetical protein
MIKRKRAKRLIIVVKNSIRVLFLNMLIILRNGNKKYIHIVRMLSYIQSYVWVYITNHPSHAVHTFSHRRFEIFEELATFSAQYQYK